MEGLPWVCSGVVVGQQLADLIQHAGSVPAGHRLCYSGGDGDPGLRKAVQGACRPGGNGVILCGRISTRGVFQTIRRACRCCHLPG